MSIESICNKASIREKEYAKELNKLAESIDHEMLASLLKGIAMDSLKHGILYEVAAKIASGRVGILSIEALRELRSKIEKHIRDEEEMIRLAETLIKSTSDPRLQLIFSAIYEDELRHHSLLKSILENIAEKEAFSEEEFWKNVWSESRIASRHRVTGPRSST